MSDLLGEVRALVEQEESVVVATVVQSSRGAGARMLIYPDGSTRGSLDGLVDEGRAMTDALEQLRRAASKTLEYPGADGETLVFYDVFPSPARLLIFGGVHIAVPLVELATTLDFRTTVVDARGQFANRNRFPRASEVVVAYADDYLADRRLDASTYVVVLTHDPKLDDPAIIHALRAPVVGYVGAIGSRKTHAKRVERLKEAGLTDEQIGRIYAPIGLDIDARNPEEIALSILAEIVAVRNGAPLAKRERPAALAAGG
ncbi:MAG: XdhC/CoxI family protein [Chloroflexota bacterium]|nr:XdhC/CoxI family protein [Chloroflexota bacterium]